MIPGTCYAHHSSTEQVLVLYEYSYDTWVGLGEEELYAEGRHLQQRFMSYKNFILDSRLKVIIDGQHAF